uniref:RING-type domain-containing protein n=1 Tax=Sinocyclocheilus anshuiensis TaxID=1608454 RepID=A0A671KUK5_9TELE
MAIKCPNFSVGDISSFLFPDMASSGALLAEELHCSICLDVFTDPVSTPCGHNFCKSCLSQCWDSSQTCKCPYCKEAFNQRPDLKINITLRMVSCFLTYFQLKCNIE